MAQSALDGYHGLQLDWISGGDSAGPGMTNPQLPLTWEVPSHRPPKTRLLSVIRSGFPSDQGNSMYIVRVKEYLQRDALVSDTKLGLLP